MCKILDSLFFLWKFRGYNIFDSYLIGGLLEVLTKDRLNNRYILNEPTDTYNLLNKDREFGNNELNKLVRERSRNAVFCTK